MGPPEKTPYTNHAMNAIQDQVAELAQNVHLVKANTNLAKCLLLDEPQIDEVQ
jgi:hypothetical protein